LAVDASLRTFVLQAESKELCRRWLIEHLGWFVDAMLTLSTSAPSLPRVSTAPKKELEGKQKSMKTSFREMSDGLQCLVLLVDGLKEKDCRTSE
jgi:hypothetical protein